MRYKAQLQVKLFWSIVKDLPTKTRKSVIIINVIAKVIDLKAKWGNIRLIMEDLLVYKN